MNFALLFGWLLSLWILGWAVLPYSRRIFARLPDEGLAAGRVLFVVLATLLCFWLASLRLISLEWAPAIFLTLAISAGWGWLKPQNRARFLGNWRVKLVSDAVFLGAFGVLIWLRSGNPSAQHFESPMDMALLSGAMRADFLPFTNPWWSDAPFTNYYYFGHLCAALLAKTLLAAPHLAYNLALAAFGAFFLSTLWSAGAALTNSAKFGVLVALLVGLGGHLEPLRQIGESGQFWPLDWWKTSRVIPNTINEYPAFTLFLGDLHAHFFALCFAVLWICLAFSLFGAPPKRRAAILLLGGAVLGAWLMTNTWDAPVFALLFALVAWKTAPREAKFPVFLGVFPLALLFAAPYFWRFESQVSGVQWALWRPNFASFLLLWGGWAILAILALALPRETQNRDAQNFRRALIFAGVVALLLPFGFYIKGYFGDGDLRHQDTVFKFGLQAWILLGTGLCAELFARFRAWKAPRKTVFAGVVAAPLLVVLALAPLAVWKYRAGDGAAPRSLSAMQFLGEADQKAIEWLRKNAPKNAVILQNVEVHNGQIVGAYDGKAGRIATFSGVPTPLGWSQHAGFWGADFGAIEARKSAIPQIFASGDWPRAWRELRASHVYFAGDAPPNLPEKSQKWQFAGDDGSKVTIFALGEWVR